MSLLDVPPNDIGVESCLLGALLHAAANGDGITVEHTLSTITPADFVSIPHRELFGVIQTAAMTGAPCDLAMIRAECESAKVLEKIGGNDFLLSLVASVEGSYNLAGYAAKIRDLSTRREVLRVAEGLRVDALSLRGTAEELIGHGENVLSRISRTSLSIRPVRGLDVGAELTDEWEGRYVPPPAFSTGLTGLDDRTGGFHEGQLITVAGATGMGKSTFALNVIRRAIDRNEPVLLFTLEMSRKEVVRSILCADCGVDTRVAMRTSKLSKEEKARLSVSYDKGFLRALHVLDNPTMTAAQIRSVAKRDIQTRGTRLVVIDYVQLIAPGAVESEAQTREQQVASISRSMKALARETKVPVLILAQLNRDADKRPPGERHPRLSDMRESAAMTHDSDLVLGIYRAGYYDPSNMLLANQMDVIVLKQRFGPTGRVPLSYSARSAWVGDLRTGESS